MVFNLLIQIFLASSLLGPVPPWYMASLVTRSINTENIDSNGISLVNRIAMDFSLLHAGLSGIVVHCNKLTIVGAHLRLTAENFFGDGTGIPGLLRADQRCKPLLQSLHLMVRNCTRD